jgi:hypothetical protein
MLIKAKWRKSRVKDVWYLKANNEHLYVLQKIDSDFWLWTGAGGGQATSAKLALRHIRRELGVTARREAVVHLVGYASQHYVRFWCTSADSYVCPGHHQDGLPDGVNRADAGLYTFDGQKVTCSACKRIAARVESVLVAEVNEVTK